MRNENETDVRARSVQRKRRVREGVGGVDKSKRMIKKREEEKKSPWEMVKRRKRTRRDEKIRGVWDSTTGFRFEGCVVRWVAVG